MRKVTADHQTHYDDQQKADQTGGQGGLDEGQCDQYRHEGTGGLDADQDAQDHYHQGADRNQQDGHEKRLLFQRQAVDREIEQRRIGGLIVLDGVGRLTVAQHRERDVRLRAALYFQYRPGGALPQEKIVGFVFGTGDRVDQDGAFVVEHFDPGRQMLTSPPIFKQQAAHLARSDAGLVEQANEQGRFRKLREQKTCVFVLMFSAYVAYQCPGEAERVGRTPPGAFDDVVRGNFVGAVPEHFGGDFRRRDGYALLGGGDKNLGRVIKLLGAMG